MRLIWITALAPQLRAALGVRVRRSHQSHTIPKIIWVTGQWAAGTDEFQKISDNLNRPDIGQQEGSDQANSSLWRPVSDLSDQARAERKFGKWVPIGSQIRYLTDDSLKSSVQEISAMLEERNVTSSAFKAFSNLRPAAYRADLWRYMVLWAYGGVYVDANIRLTSKLDTWIDFEKDELVLVADLGGRAYWNALMAASSQNVYLEQVIQSVVDTIVNHGYGPAPPPGDSLSITGPTALFNALRGMGLKKFFKFLRRTRCELKKVNTDEATREIKVVLPSGESVATKDERLHSFNDPRKHYFPLYHHHQVYCDEPGPDDDLGMCSGKASAPV